MTSELPRLIGHNSKGHLLIALVIGLAFCGLPAQHLVQGSALLADLPRTSGMPTPLAAFASSSPYIDEQVGITFTQDFSRLVFNVTAVAFTDNGIGPGYLVNGLTDRGYWYQVGLSYNWPTTNNVVYPGFSMNYEVFDSSPRSIYPTDGGGGIQAFNGTVNNGDSVLLSLTFSGGLVVMRATDWQTGAAASQSYNSYAYRKVFIGLTSSLAQSGFFSGLMTEQYHYSPYFGAGLPVKYSMTGSSISSAWMWMDEWYTNTGQPVFDASTPTPVVLNQSVGHYFASNGTAEIANAHTLITGLTPVTFPILLASSQGYGQPGHLASIQVSVEDQNGATVRFENVSVSASFGRYNFTLETPFSFGSGLGQYELTIDIPPNLALGPYNVTIDVISWEYMDTQAQAWIPLHPDSVNETLILTNNPPLPSNPPNSPGPSPPPGSGQGPSTSTNGTTSSPSLVLNILRSMVIPIAGSYIALGLLAAVLLIRQEHRQSRTAPTFGLRFCASCGREMSSENMTCPNCNSAINNEDSVNSATAQQDQTQGPLESDASPGGVP